MKFVESLAPGANEIVPPDITTPASVTSTPVKVTFPVLVTVKAYVISSPTAATQFPV